MTNEALVKKLKNLMIMYGELYFQRRVIEELRKNDNIYENYPEIPPESNMGFQVATSWGIFLLLAGLTIYFLVAKGSLWCLVTAATAFVAFIIAGTITESDEKQTFQRNRAVKEYENVKNTNAERKKDYPDICRIVDAFAREYSKAEEESQKLVTEACDTLKLKSRYRNYACVCSLYQYLYTDVETTLIQGYEHLDRVISSGDYICNPAEALKKMERVKVLQPVLIERLPRQEKDVVATTKYLCDCAVWIAHKNKSEGLSGDTLDYELAKYVTQLRNESFDYDICEGKSVSTSVLHVRCSYREIVEYWC